VNNTDQIVDSYWENPSHPQSINVWDDGYPSGGNYWSDHNDTDVYSGPHQNETGPDGISDIPYEIDRDNVDYYPLMSSYVESERPIAYIDSI